MVLPNGHHVRFGPSEWEDASADGFIVPPTIDVPGLYHSNPEEQDKKKQRWGTLGVVTSLYLQLHEYNRFELYGLGDGVTGDLGVKPTEECAVLMPTITLLFTEFIPTYTMVPSLIGVSEDHSTACGSQDGLRLFCYGDEDIEQAWAMFLGKKNVTDLREGDFLLEITSMEGFKDLQILQFVLAHRTPARKEGSMMILQS